MADRKKNAIDFEEQFGQSKIKTLKEQLKAEQHKVETLSEVQYKTSIVKTEENTIHFAVIADTHCGSLYHDGDALHAFFEYAQDNGVRAFYHCGDVLEGHRIYKGQEFELKDVGLQAQIDRAVGEWPRLEPDTMVFAIDGNHDQSFEKLTGYPTGSLLEQAMGDQWKYIGKDSADILFDTPNGEFTLRIEHPGGGCSYALSYQPQKRIEQISGGQKPNMICDGHYHKTLQMPSYRNVAGILAGCFQKQTPFMAGKGLAAHIGGWIFEITPSESRYTVINSEFVPFFE